MLPYKLVTEIILPSIFKFKSSLFFFLSPRIINLEYNSVNSYGFFALVLTLIKSCKVLSLIWVKTDAHAFWIMTSWSQSNETTLRNRIHRSIKLENFWIVATENFTHQTSTRPVLIEVEYSSEWRPKSLRCSMS